MLNKSSFFRSILLAWLLLTFILYAWVSRLSYLMGFFPQDVAHFLTHLARISPLTYLFDLVRAFWGMTLFAFAALELGLTLLPRRTLTDTPPLARGAVAFTLGEVVFSLLFLIILRLWRLPPLLTGLTYALALMAGLPALLRFFRSLPRPSLPADWGRTERRFLALLLTLLALGLTLASARLGYDAVVEYFSHAKIMAVSQQPVFLYPKDSFVVSSFHPGILFTVQIQIFGDQSARMLSWLNGTVLLLLTWALGERMGLSPLARLYALMLLVTSTAFLDLLGDGKIELISTAPLLAAVYMAQNSSCAAQDKSCATCVGLLAGFAIISRPYNIFLVPCFGMLFLATQAIAQASTLRQGFVRLKEQFKDLRQAASSLFWLVLPIVLLGLFHLWQNTLWLGSPLAPLTYARELNSGIWQWQFDPSLLNTLKWLYPLTLTFFNTPQSLGNLSPLFVGFLPLLLLPAVRRNVSLSPQMRALLFAALLTLLAWVTFFFTVVEIRYVLFLWILLFLPAGQVIESASEHSGRFLQPFLRPLMATLLMFLGLRTLAIALDTYSPIDVDGWAHCYDSALCTFFEPVNQTASPGERVLVLNAYRYYLRPDLFVCSSRSNEYPALQELAQKDSPEFWVEVYRYGYRFVIYERNFAEFHSHFGTIPESQIAPSWLQFSVISSSEDNDEIVYLIQAVNPPIQPEVHCQLDLRGNWNLTSLPALQRYQFPQYIEKYPR